jgi:hypothetical protein
MEPEPEAKPEPKDFPSWPLASMPKDFAASHQTQTEPEKPKVRYVERDARFDALAAVTRLHITLEQVHLPLLNMHPYPTLIPIHPNASNSTNLAPLPEASDSEATPPRKTRAEIARINKEARESVARARKKRQQEERDNVPPMDLAKLALPDEYEGQPVPPTPDWIKQSKKAKQGDELKSEDESTDSNPDSQDVEMLQDHPDDERKLAKLAASPPSPPRSPEIVIPDHLEPGREVDEEEEGSYGDDEGELFEGQADRQDEERFKAQEPKFLDTGTDVEIDASMFFWAVPTGSTTGKQKLHIRDLECEGGSRLATKEESAIYRDLPSDSD